MYIGIIDDDFRFKTPHYPNLELMKLSAYCKSNKHIVEYFQDYRNYERYSEIYIGKNKNLDDFPDLFLSLARRKTNYVGKAFYGDNYIPMSEEIESCLPDRTIYDMALKKLSKNHPFRVNINKNFVRLQTATEIIIENPNKSILVYDKNAYTYDLFEELEYYKTICFVEPQIYTDLSAAIVFASKQNTATDTTILLDSSVSVSDYLTIGEAKPRAPIYLKIIPDKYAKVGDATAAGIINSYLSEIERMKKLTKGKGKVYNVFTNSKAKYLLNVVNRDGKYQESEVSKHFSQYPALLSTIKQIWREGK